MGAAAQRHHEVRAQEYGDVAGLHDFRGFGELFVVDVAGVLRRRTPPLQ
ncbi:hypothetical protein FrEUN1fDRAFT_2301 [Parafrankia sp. EUN1f]|nr:hypothetical protein FrEUN1fDRAFT_2301 [Parafrankia sp. EUN1f]